MVSGRRAFSRVVLVALATAAFGCVSPTLPLPPPETPVITIGSAPGTYVLAGSKGAALPDAFLIAINENPSLERSKRVSGTQAEADGAWRMQIFASPGDLIDLSQERSDQRSPSLSIRIPR